MVRAAAQHWSLSAIVFTLPLEYAALFKKHFLLNFLQNNDMKKKGPFRKYITKLFPSYTMIMFHRTLGAKLKFEDHKFYIQIFSVFVYIFFWSVQYCCMSSTAVFSTAVCLPMQCSVPLYTIHWSVQYCCMSSTAVFSTAVYLPLQCLVLLYIFHCCVQYCCMYSTVVFSTAVCLSLQCSVLLYIFQCIVQYCCIFSTEVFSTAVCLSL